MSFILDALRKSESQRRLEAVPEVMRVPIAVQRNRVPPWAIAVMATLGLALAASAVVGWRNQQARPLASLAIPADDSGTTLVERSASPARVVTPQAAIDDAAARDPADAAPAGDTEVARTVAGNDVDVTAREVGRPAPTDAAAPARETERAAARRITPDARGADPTAEGAARAPAPPTSIPASDGGGAQPDAPGASVDVSALPSVAALQASGVAIPELDLQLLVTSSTPASRLVVINGRRYHEGDRLIEGSEVVEINDQGAVMRHAGRDFLLVPD